MTSKIFTRRGLLVSSAAGVALGSSALLPALANGLAPTPTVVRITICRMRLWSSGSAAAGSG
jgi:hypothetical protein